LVVLIIWVFKDLCQKTQCGVWICLDIIEAMASALDWDQVSSSFWSLFVLEEIGVGEFGIVTKVIELKVLCVCGVGRKQGDLAHCHFVFVCVEPVS